LVSVFETLTFPYLILVPRLFTAFLRGTSDAYRGALQQLFIFSEQRGVSGVIELEKPVSLFLAGVMEARRVFE